MTNLQNDFETRLINAAVSLNVNLNEKQREKILRYINQLQRWNKTYNLTAVRDPEQMLIQHVFDSLSVVPPIDELVGTKKTNSVKIMDVGSGGGLPGVILAIAKPEWDITCVDAVEKKMAFVRQMSAVLELPNLQATHQRVETIEPYQADIVISRAFASLVDFVSLASRHVGDEGLMLAMKGREPDDEIAELEKLGGWKVEQIKPLSVPELDAQRCLVYLSQQG